MHITTSMIYCISNNVLKSSAAHIFPNFISYSPTPSHGYRSPRPPVVSQTESICKQQFQCSSNGTVLSNKIETSWETEKNAGYHHFVCFHNVFKRVLSREAVSHSSVGSVADLRTGGRWFDHRLGQYSFSGLMILIATGVILLSLLSVVSTMIMWESSQWLGKNIVRSTG